MSDLYASLDGVQVIDGRIVVPRIGAWYAELTLASEHAIGGISTLTVADIAWKCAPWRIASYQGRTRVRVVGGAAGWQKQIPARSYQSNPKLSTILTDAAGACGEIGVAVASDFIVGPFAIRDVGPAQRMLARYAPEWHIMPDGRTYVGPWQDITKVTDRIDLTGYDGAEGRAEIATEALASILPGRTVASPLIGFDLVVGAVTHALQGTSVRTQIMIAERRP
jgi:hypothetical protein